MSETERAKLSAADEAQMALCHLSWISTLPGVHPHRLTVIRGALERLAALALPASGSLREWQAKLIELVIERAQQACRQALKHQNFDGEANPEYRSGFEVAVDVCEAAIKHSVTKHIENDIADAALSPSPASPEGDHVTAK